MCPATRQAIAATLAVCLFSMFAPSHAYAHGGGGGGGHSGGGGHGGGGGYHGGSTSSASVSRGAWGGSAYGSPAFSLPGGGWSGFPDDLIEARLHRFITQHLKWWHPEERHRHPPRL